MPPVLVGHDAAVYTVASVIPVLNSSPAIGTPVNFLGMFKDFSLDAKNEWIEVPASSATEQERRNTLLDWTLTLNNQIRSGGSLSLSLLVQRILYLQVIWQDEPGGLILTATGGLESCTMKRDKSEGIQTMQIIDTGTIITNGLPTLTYQ